MKNNKPSKNNLRQNSTKNKKVNINPHINKDNNKNKINKSKQIINMDLIYMIKKTHKNLIDNF